MSSEFIYCMECGARLPAEARFCNVCGTRVLRPEVPEPAPAPPSWQTPPETPADDEGWQPVGAGVDDQELDVPEAPEGGAVTAEGPAYEAPEAAAPEPPEGGPIAPEAPAYEAPLAAEEPESRKWVWGEHSEEPAPTEPALSTETTEMPVEPAPAVVPEQGEEIVETRRYPPREEVRREDLDDYRSQQTGVDETRAVDTGYDEERAGLGIRPGILMAAIGFAVALAGVFFPWVSIEGTDVNALDETITAQIAGREVEGSFEFQVQDALDNEERLDGYIVIGLCAAGIFFLFLEYVLLRRFPIGRVYAALGGLAVGALGVVELLYIRDVVPDNVSFSYEPGLFMVTIGGAAAIVGSLIPVGSGEE